MKFEVITAQDDRWDRYIEMLPYDLRDVHVSRAWMRAHEEVMGGTAMLAVLEHDENFVIVEPFMLRPISDGWFDATSVGYGGPLSSSSLPTRLHGVDWDYYFYQGCLANKVVTQFTMMSPFAEGHQQLLTSWPLTSEKNVVILPLGPEADMLERMKPKRRHCVVKARARGMVAVPPFESDAVNMFAENYNHAMARKGAPTRWSRSAEYFARIGVGCGGLMLEAREEGERHASAIFTAGKDSAYYEFAASVGTPIDGASDLLILEAAQWARGKGCTWLHLGGGVTSSPDDSLLAYKRSFGGYVRCVSSVRRILDNRAYKALCDAKGINPADDGFFPAYRKDEAA